MQSEQLPNEISVELPYSFGTIVEVTFDDGSKKVGEVVSYIVSDDGYTVWVSGIGESWSGEFLPEDVIKL